MNPSSQSYRDRLRQAQAALSEARAGGNAKAVEAAVRGVDNARAQLLQSQVKAYRNKVMARR